MPYRNESEALTARQEALEAELAKTRDQLDAFRHASDRVQKIEAQLKELRARATAVTDGRARSPLDGIKIASPCNESWDDMQGDDRMRHCDKCHKNVFNIAGMPRGEAEALLAERNESVCIRLYSRPDGTVITGDCPEGVSLRRRRRVTLVVLSATAIAGVAALGHQMFEPRAVHTKHYVAAQRVKAEDKTAGLPCAASAKPRVENRMTIGEYAATPKEDKLAPYLESEPGPFDE